MSPRGVRLWPLSEGQGRERGDTAVTGPRFEPPPAPGASMTKVAEANGLGGPFRASMLHSERLGSRGQAACSRGRRPLGSSKRRGVRSPRKTRAVAPDAAGPP